MLFWFYGYIGKFYFLCPKGLLGQQKSYMGISIKLKDNMKLTSKEIFEKALKTVKNPDDILELHAKTYEILKMQKERYYRDRLEVLKLWI